MNSTNDDRDLNNLRHFAQRSRNPNLSRGVKASHSSAPVQMEQTFGEVSDAASSRFNHVGTSQKNTQQQNMSVRRMMHARP